MNSLLLLFALFVIREIWANPIEISLDEIIGNKTLRNFLRDLEKQLNNKKISMSTLNDIIHIEKDEETTKDTLQLKNEDSFNKKKNEFSSELINNSMKSSPLKDIKKIDAENEFDNNMVHKLFDFLSSDKESTNKTSKNALEVKKSKDIDNKISQKDETKSNDTKISSMTQIQTKENDTNEKVKSQTEEKNKSQNPNEKENEGKENEKSVDSPQVIAKSKEKHNNILPSDPNKTETPQKDSKEDNTAGDVSDNIKKSKPKTADKKEQNSEMAEKIKEDPKRKNSSEDKKQTAHDVESKQKHDNPSNEVSTNEKTEEGTNATKEETKNIDRENKSSEKEDNTDNKKVVTGKKDEKPIDSGRKDTSQADEHVQESNPSDSDGPKDKQTKKDVSWKEDDNSSSDNISTSQKNPKEKKLSDIGIKSERINEDTERSVRNELENRKDSNIKEKRQDEPKSQNEEDIEGNLKQYKKENREVEDPKTLKENKGDSDMPSQDLTLHDEKKEKQLKQTKDNPEDVDFQDSDRQTKDLKKQKVRTENSQEGNLKRKNDETVYEGRKVQNNSVKENQIENRSSKPEDAELKNSNDGNSETREQPRGDSKLGSKPSDSKNISLEIKDNASPNQIVIDTQFGDIKKQTKDALNKGPYKKPENPESKNKKTSQSDELASKLKKLISSIKKMNEQSKNHNKILISFDPKKSQIRLKILPQAEVLEEEKKLIIGGMKLVSIFERNMDVLKSVYPKDTYGKIKDVLIYEAEDGRILEYWGKIQFHKNKNNEYIDETGFLSGKMVKKFENIIAEGLLAETGFFQSKDISEKDIEESFDIMQRLIIEIAKIKGMKVKEIMNDEPYFTSLDKMIYREAYHAPTHGPGACKYVCKCNDSECKSGCDNIKCLSNNLIREIFNH